MERFGGLIAAAYTPMRPDGSVELDVVDRLAERFVADGLSGVFPCGTTGEFPALTMAEREAVAARWVQAAAGRLRVIVHVGGTCLEDCRSLASHAQSIGADGISAMAPYFFLPTTTAELVEFMANIAEAAPELPFFYYHIPVINRVDLPMREFLESGAERIPTLTGLKFTHLDAMDLRICAELDGGRFDILYGSDETLLSGLVTGACGAVGTTYGFTAPLSIGIVDAVARGDLEEARRRQLISARLVAVYRRYGGHRAMKAMMEVSGIDCGGPRLPVTPLGADERDAMVAELEAIGFREFLSARA